MLTPFLKYVSEGRVIRRHSDLQRYTFPEVTERIYLSFLALSLLRNLEQSKTFTKMYADQTMAKGTFDQVRMMNNDLANKKIKEQKSSTGHEAETACSCYGN